MYMYLIAEYIILINIWKLPTMISLKIFAFIKIQKCY